LAYRPLQPYSWKPIEGGGRRLFSPHLKNGAVVQVAAAWEFADMSAFRSTILSLPLEIRTDPTPSVKFRSLRGKNLEFTYGEVPRVNGAAIDYAKWPLFGGPFVEADVDSERLTLKHGKLRRTLDFRTLQISDR
ncbi:MAG: hypothetical protein H7Y20_10740, partial [Bryobacteraceae bacterium]|nr:hypothetical protein [Bryobacteraceae bacterium]